MKKTKDKKVENIIIRNNFGDIEKLQAAKVLKNDEFYTSESDIISELSHWGSKLTGKNIICPCDWDIFDTEDAFSMTVEFSETSEPCIYSRTHSINKVKKIMYTIEDSITNAYVENIVTSDEEIDNLIKERVKCNFLKVLCELGEEYGAKSITASGYDPETGRGYDFRFVDYTPYDICITNPPFSLYTDFIKLMLAEVDRKKELDKRFDFIILSPYLNRVNPNIGLPLMLEKCYLGYGRQIAMNFICPTKELCYKTKSVAVDWITTFDDAQKEVNSSNKEYLVDYTIYKKNYLFMENMTMKDGTHPLLIATKKAIPFNYDGWMFCGPGVLDDLNTDKYEWYGTNYKGYYNRNLNESPFAHLASDKMVKKPNGKGFHGILIRKKLN